MTKVFTCSRRWWLTLIRRLACCTKRSSVRRCRSFASRTLITRDDEMNLALPDTYNAATTFVDENIAAGRGKRTAIYYQDEKFTYQDVFEKVNRTGNALKELGVEIEQRVLLALPDCPEFA